jgi:hypothetical protein
MRLRSFRGLAQQGGATALVILASLLAVAIGP